MNECIRGAARALFAVTLVVAFGYGIAARADEVTSKGTMLRGKITALAAAGITFAPEYGTGELAIKWDAIDDVKSDTPFQVLYGDDQEVDAPLRGFRQGRLTVGTASIDVATIAAGIPIGDGGPSFADRMRSTWRYWDGNFDLGVNVQQSTTDTTGFVLGLKTTRSRGPTRFTFATNYRYGTEKKSGQTRSRTLDQLLGLVRGEYDLTPRLYGFASGDATYDGIQQLSIRGVPKLGVGYKLWEEQLDEARQNFLAAEAGGGWVYEKYFGGADNDFFTIALGAAARYHLPYGTRFDWRMDYLPAVEDFTGDYLLRNEAGLLVPLLDPIGAKFALVDEYDSTPATDAKHNSLFLTFGLSLIW
jgi:hypothetical protein